MKTLIQKPRQQALQRGEIFSNSVHDVMRLEDESCKADYKPVYYFLPDSYIIFLCFHAVTEIIFENVSWREEKKLGKIELLYSRLCFILNKIWSSGVSCRKIFNHLHEVKFNSLIQTLFFNSNLVFACLLHTQKLYWRTEMNSCVVACGVYWHATQMGGINTAHEARTTVCLCR